TPDEQAELLPGLASGETIATLASSEPNGRWDASGITTEARVDGGSWLIEGSKTGVIDGHLADLLVVVARDPGRSGEDGIGFFVVDGDAEGLTRTPLATIDLTRKQARLDMSSVRARRIGEPGVGGPALSKTMQHAVVALSNEMAGSGERALEMAVEY